MTINRSLRYQNLLDRELAALENKRQKLYALLEEQHSRADTLNQLKKQLTKKNTKLSNIDSQLIDSGIKMTKLAAKAKQLSQQRLTQIVKLEDYSIQCEHLQKQTVDLYTPKTDEITDLRLRLIEIQTSDQLHDFQEIFTLRKTIFSFLKHEKINTEGKTWSEGVELGICRQKLVQKFSDYLFTDIGEKKLGQYKFTIKQPIQHYIEVLKRIQLIYLQASAQDLKQKNVFDELSANQTLKKLRQVETEQNNTKRNIQRINQKLERNQIKTQKYQQYITTLRLEKEELIKDIQQGEGYLKSQGTDRMQDFSRQLYEIEQAIDYLSMKRNNSENINTINSPKTMALMNKFQSPYKTPQILKFHN